MSGRTIAGVAAHLVGEGGRVLMARELSNAGITSMATATMSPAIDRVIAGTTASSTTATTTLEATAGGVKEGSLGLMESRGLGGWNRGLGSVATTSYHLGLDEAHGLLHQ